MNLKNNKFFMLGRGFMYDVIEDNGRVIKIPRKPKTTSIIKEQLSLTTHKNYIGEYIPETSIDISDLHGFLVNQELINEGNPVDLAKENVKEDVRRLLEGGRKMQNEQNIFFDVFGMQGMIHLFNYYFSGTAIKKLSDLLLPINAKYLEMIYDFPPDALYAFNNDTKSSAFLAYNILRDKNGKLHFVDTDYRPLDIFHPLNLVGNWITEKALNDVSRIT